MSFLHWIILAVLCGVIEILSLGLWFLWLAISALFVALGAYYLIFFGVYGKPIAGFRPINLNIYYFYPSPVFKFFKSKRRISNVSALIGQHGIVTQEITPLQYGQVKLNGEIWTAVPVKKLKLGPSSRHSHRGVKLFVQKAE
jgi:membrane protein implicated in regulation of membrane protease activity